MGTICAQELEGSRIERDQAKASVLELQTGMRTLNERIREREENHATLAAQLKQQVSNLEEVLPLNHQ